MEGAGGFAKPVNTSLGLMYKLVCLLVAATDVLAYGKALAIIQP